MVAEEQQQVGQRQEHERHRDPRQQQPVAAQAAAATGHAEHQQHAAEGAEEGRQRQGQQADHLADVEHHQHRAEGRAGGGAEQVRIGQRIARDRLQGRSHQRQAGADAGTEQYPWGADQPDDVLLAGAPGTGLRRHAEQALEDDAADQAAVQSRRTEAEGDHAGQAEQHDQAAQQQAIGARAAEQGHGRGARGWRPATRVSIAAALPMPGVAWL